MARQPSIPLKLLAYLLERPGLVISREELLRAVWGYRVEEENLKANISTLRQLLSDDAKQPRYIATVGSGYRFIATVEELPDLDEAPPPPRAIAGESWWIPRERELVDLLHRLGQPAAPVLLTGPEGIGKTTLLAAAARELTRREGAQRIIRWDLRAADPDAWAGLDPLLRELGQWLIAGLTSEPLPALWCGTTTPRQKLTALLERYVLGAAGTSLLIVDHLEHAESAQREHPGAPALVSQLVGLLRSWSERAREPQSPYQRLRLGLAVATRPDAMAANVHQSPFNLAAPLCLEDLDREQTSLFAARYGVGGSSADVLAARGRIGGHPGLWHQLLYAARAEHVTLEQALLREDQVFAHTLQRVLWALRKAGLYDVLQRALANPTQRLDLAEEHRLVQAGVLQGPPYRLRYGLYERLLR